MVGVWTVIGLASLFSVLFTISFGLIFRRLWVRRWNIPVVVMQYTGDKRRPAFKFTRGRRQYNLGRNRLWVRGYKLPLRDFKNEYYYPAGLKGGLVLWEFKKGWLTPVIPKKAKITRKQLKELELAIEKARGMGVVDFEFNPDLYHNLTVKAVDDIDVEWFLRQQDRINAQYTTGWRDFLSKYGGHLIVGIVAMFMLVGFIVWLKEAPSQAGQCIQAGVEAARETYLSDLASRVPGTPAPPG